MQQLLRELGPELVKFSGVPAGPEVPRFGACSKKQIWSLLAHCRQIIAKVSRRETTRLIDSPHSVRLLPDKLCGKGNGEKEWGVKRAQQKGVKHESVLFHGLHRPRIAI